MDSRDTQPEPNKGGRPPEGRYHGVRIPDDLWDWCKAQTGNASETIRELIRIAKEDEQK